MAPRGSRRRRVEERISDPRLSDPPAGPSLRGVALGCLAALLALVVVAGAAGLLYGLWSRFGRPALVAQTEEWRDDGSEAQVDRDSPEDGSGTTSQDDDRARPDEAAILADMRRRYVPGPHVRVEGMIPSPRALGGPAPGSMPAARAGASPWQVLGARYEAGQPPGASPGATARVSHPAGARVDQPLTILPAVPTQVEVSASDARGGTEVTSYIVSFPGYAGHFLLPATAPTELGMVSASGSDGATVRFAIAAPMQPDGRMATAPFDARIQIAAVDARGNVSEPVERWLSVMPVGTGDVEVALTMSEPTDLDLYVADPTGDVIFFGNTRGRTGGHLDLDANAACSSNLGVNNEHIYWPRGRAPRGTYEVRVAHYESCLGGRPVEYRVTVRSCDETVVLSGRFEGMGRADRCLSGSQQPYYCQDVVRFTVPACAGSVNAP